MELSWVAVHSAMNILISERLIYSTFRDFDLKRSSNIVFNSYLLEQILLKAWKIATRANW